MITFVETEQRWKGKVYVDGKYKVIKNSKNKQLVEDIMKDYERIMATRLTKKQYLAMVYKDLK